MYVLCEKGVSCIYKMYRFRSAKADCADRPWTIFKSIFWTSKDSSSLCFRQDQIDGTCIYRRQMQYLISTKCSKRKDNILVLLSKLLCGRGSKEAYIIYGVEVLHETDSKFKKTTTLKWKLWRQFFCIKTKRSQND